MFASCQGNKEVVESLLSAGADMNYQNNVCDIYCCCESCFKNLFVICGMMLFFLTFDVLVLFSFE